MEVRIYFVTRIDGPLGAALSSGLRNDVRRDNFAEAQLRSSSPGFDRLFDKGRSETRRSVCRRRLGEEGSRADLRTTER